MHCCTNFSIASGRKCTTEPKEFLEKHQIYVDGYGLVPDSYDFSELARKSYMGNLHIHKSFYYCQGCKDQLMNEKNVPMKMREKLTTQNIAKMIIRIYNSVEKILSNTGYNRITKKNGDYIHQKLYGNCWCNTDFFNEENKLLKKLIQWGILYNKTDETKRKQEINKKIQEEITESKLRVKQAVEDAPPYYEGGIRPPCWKNIVGIGFEQFMEDMKNEFSS